MNSIIDQQRQDREFTGGCSDNAYVTKSNCDDWHAPGRSLEYLHGLERIEFDISKEDLSHIQTPIEYIEFKIMGCGPYVVDQVIPEGDVFHVIAHKKEIQNMNI